MPPRRSDGSPLTELTRINLDPELGIAFEALAKQHDRSLVAETRVALRHWVAAHQPDAAAPAAGAVPAAIS
jgi:predicted transcriptional regulator